MSSRAHSLPRLTSFCLFLLIAAAAVATSGCRRHTAPAAPADPPAHVQASVQNIPPTCGGGSGVTPGKHPMNSTESAMANAINNYRSSRGQPTLTLGHGTGEGVCQWCAADMNNNDYVGLIGSDGEDVTQRAACSGLTKGLAGIIAAGQSTNVHATLRAIEASAGGSAALLATGNYLNVGYNNGFWMILIH